MISALPLPGFIRKPHLLFLSNEDSSAGCWSKGGPWNCLSVSVDKAGKAGYLLKQNGTPDPVCLGWRLPLLPLKPWAVQVTCLLPAIPCCGASSQAPTEHQPRPAAAGASSHLCAGGSWRWHRAAAQPGMSLPAGLQCRSPAQVTALPAAVDCVGDFLVLGHRAAGPGLQVGRRGACACLDGRTAAC